MTVLTAEQVLNLALGAGFTRAEANEMTVIAHYESGWDPSNLGDQTLSKYGSIGLWQIFTGAHRPSEFGLGSSGWNRPLIAELASPATNAKAAHVVFKEQGYSAWSTYNHYHSDASWANLLAKVAAINVSGSVSPLPMVAKPSKNYLASKGNNNPLGTKGVEAAKAREASGASLGAGTCLKTVRIDYGITKTIPDATASWHSVPSKYQHTWYNAPYGTPVFWTGGSTGAGHVAIADGLGNVYSTDFGSNGYIGDGKTRLIPTGAVSAHDKALKYAGWSEFLNGTRVYD